MHTEEDEELHAPFLEQLLMRGNRLKKVALAVTVTGTKWHFVLLMLEGICEMFWVVFDK